MSTFRWVDLLPHPEFPMPEVKRVRAGYEINSRGWKLSYEVYGEIDELDISSFRSARRSDEELWQHSCFEVFLWAATHRYRELNFATDGRWNAYDFEGYRRGRRPVRENIVSDIDAMDDAERYKLSVQLPLAAIPDMVTQVGLSVILQSKMGEQSYWALKHSGVKPDFHHVSAFALPVRE